MLSEIWTGYPRFQLKSEEGIPSAKIRTFPWIQALYMGKNRWGIRTPEALDRVWCWLAQTTLDDYVSKRLTPRTSLIALSGSGLKSGARTKAMGGLFFCDRGSAHIRVQDRLLREEYERWGLRFKGVDPRMIAREEMEYDIADYISVPSTFVAKSFIEMGVPEAKLFVNPYGARLERFRPHGSPDPKTFKILFVGNVSIRKGCLYLLDAFARLERPGKELLFVGHVSEDIKPLLQRAISPGVTFVGSVPNADLPRIYSSAHVMVLPSIEEGLAMVMGEALACGCPVIASENTGAANLFSDGSEGFIVAPRDTDALVERLQELGDDETLRQQMASNAIRRVEAIGGWDAYGERWNRKLRS